MSKGKNDRWVSGRLADFADVRKGITYTTADYGDKHTGRPFITLKCIEKNGGFSKEGLKFFVTSVDESYYLDQGELLFANTDLTRNGDVVGSAMLLPKLDHPKSPVFSMDLSKLTPKIGVSDRRYLYYLLSTPQVKNHFVRCSAGSTVLHLNVKDAVEINVNLPPLKEQQKIAEILTSVDEVIENTQSQISKLEDLKKATMNELLTKGIGHTEFKDTEIGRIPPSWEIFDIGQLTQKVGSGVTPRGGSQIYTTEGVKFIRSQNIYPDKILLDDIVYIPTQIDEEMSSTRILKGDVLLNITGASIGRCAVVDRDIGPANVNQHVCIIRLNKKVVPRYLMYWFNSDYGQNNISTLQAGGNREGLNFQQIKSMRVALPVVVEQHQIIRVIDGISQKLEVLKRRSEFIGNLKKSLMQDLLTGKVRVTVN
jgi:type I restriction enzyme S subunit